MKFTDRLSPQERKAMIYGAVAFDAAMEGMVDCAKDFQKKKEDLLKKQKQPVARKKP